MKQQDPPSGAAPPTLDSPSDFQQFFERHYPSLVYYFQRQGFSREEGLDLAQETFLRVHKGMGEFRGDASPKTWLYKIAKHLSMNARRYEQAVRRKHEEVSYEALLEQNHPVFPAMIGDEAEDDQLRELIRRERVRLLWRALGGLPPKMRQVLILRIQRGCKYREIADLVGISIDTVKAHLHQAKRQLTEVLQGELTPEESRGLEEDGRG